MIKPPVINRRRGSGKTIALSLGVSFVVLFGVFVAVDSARIDAAREEDRAWTEAYRSAFKAPFDQSLLKAYKAKYPDEFKAHMETAKQRLLGNE